jgi:hypothetical protein
MAPHVPPKGCVMPGLTALRRIAPGRCAHDEAEQAMPANSVFTLDPLVDERWPKFLLRHPEASVFHSVAWLSALQTTYGYEPIVFTTTPPDEAELSNGVVFCQVKSWLTGNRLVSLPFSDHCQPLACDHDLNLILESVHARKQSDRYKYIELRPLAAESIADFAPSLGVSESFKFHAIDLRADLEQIYRGFHDSCVRRKIKRAEREKLTLESGNSSALLDKFRHLLLLTRRRHKLPPQPAEWFNNLARCFGDNLTVHLLSKDACPAASILTLTYKQTVMYKYGCSDARFHNLGGMPLLFWRAIEHSKAMGMTNFDLGRSSSEDAGLVAFKGHLGAASSELRYYRDPAPPLTNHSLSQQTSWARRALAHMPEPVLVGAGNLLYRHLG